MKTKPPYDPSDHLMDSIRYTIYGHKKMKRKHTPKWLELLIGWLIIIASGLGLLLLCIVLIYPNGLPENKFLFGIIQALFTIAILAGIVWWGEKVENER